MKIGMHYDILNKDEAKIATPLRYGDRNCKEVVSGIGGKRVIYLLLAILSSAMVSICMRISEKYIRNEMAMFMANYAVCIVLSAFLMNRDTTYYTAETALPVVGLGIISGILYLAGFLFLKYNMKHNGIVLSSTFMKLGVLIPTIMAIVLFHEMPRLTQTAGIILAVTAIVMIHFEKNALHEGNKRIWLLILLFVSGITDSMANIYEQVGTPEGKDGYLLVTFFVAFLLALVCAVVNKAKISKNDLLFGMLIGIPNYFSARFLLLALGHMKAVLVYPIYSVATLVVITLVGIIVFREAVSRKKLCALGLIVLALGLLNM